jgi:hypothetical protein
MDGCPSDVALRPGSSSEVEVLFTCPASPAPLIILRGHGQTPFRKPAGVVDQGFLTDALDAATARSIHQIALYGPGDGLPPYCAADRSGLVVSVYDYAHVDEAVDGLRRWMQTNDLAVELVVRLVPDPDPGIIYMLPISE